MRPSLYVYALVNGLGAARRMAGHSIEIMSAGAVYAAVERRKRPPRLTESTLRVQHAIVTGLWRRFDAVLPARFGTLLTLEELQRVARLHGPAIRGALQRVAGRQQMTVRLTGPTLSEKRVKHSRGGPGTAYLVARREATRPRLTGVGSAIRRGVRSLASAERIEVADSGRVTLHHLVPRGTASRYRALVAGVARQASTVSIAISGPWPPFAFVPELWP